MAEMDAASEALMRRLHRELNGLTRSTRNATLPHERFKSLHIAKNDMVRGVGRKNTTPCSHDRSESEASSSVSEGKGDKPAKRQRKSGTL